MIQSLDDKRRARAATSEMIEREFRPPAVQAQYRAIYERVLRYSTQEKELGSG
jgi:hypothetical protein